MTRARSEPSEVGSGVLSTALGIMFAIILLLFCVQVMLSLYARSLVSAAAYDGARLAATASGAGGRGRAEERLEQLIGAMKPVPEWLERDADSIVLRVHATGPTLFPRVGPLHALSRIERTARVRREQFR